ncbi:accessory gene regulator ArgB-like protein [Caldisalinibacter kiritimatiensis]|uniref:Regulator protein n=1 Tax=Caldisalinibacter kiritimatiensis TaxID=1304284 RepID=R1CCJ6_9FIRM|nr:accessory gene regulator B family protein [Caldisalinibacter kiritimatiensis]EOC99989.1 regulator protein [Caldisalinibacter kiritimatiensis]
MRKLAQNIADAIKQNDSNLTELQMKKIRFGMECLLNELSKFLIYLSVFTVFGVVKQYFVSVIFFGLLRGITGGYHEDTYWKCFRTTFILFIIIIFIGTKFSFNFQVSVLLILISLIISYIYAPVDHPNKPIISKKRRIALKYFSMIIIITLGGISFLLHNSLRNVAQLAIFFDSLMIVAGYYKNKSLK